ncbi:CCR4-NOT transcription complex subunit 1-like isoform X2 [Argiope bruennichi]|uniref:CCR4-NOT transcription complex subunit 1-like isoform X2 n=1 Tax=Argiope bruennichi TaxID=94029 RepID=UPI00249462D1|nr:CCR4-NOT transcription complex subunit 1-like isoform X2 [Argiope bruennichi]
MNLDSLSFALSNISYSVANLTKKNFKSSVQEITRLVTCHGLEAERHLLRCLFSHVDFSGDGKSSGKDFHQTQLLIQECASILHKPNFVSTFCYAIDCPLQQQKSLRPSSSLLSQLSKVLKLSSVQEISFGLALLHSSIPDHINHSVNFLKLKLPDFIRNICDQDLSSLEDSFDLPPVIVHLLLHQLNCGNKDLGISSESKEKLNKRLSLDFADKVPLLPYLRVDNLDPMMENIGNVPKSSDDSLVEVIQEMGYNFTASVEECKNNMAQIGLREIKPSLVARVLSMMARSHTGLTDAMPLQNMNSNMVMWGGEKEKSEVNQQATWNVEVFVQAVRDLAPSLDWKEIVHDLDNPDFLLKDRKGLKLLWQGLILGLSQETFPMDRMYRRWRNSEGQFSFFQQVLNCCDIVCLTDYPHRPVLTDALKAPPEDDNKSISNWKSLDLIETLLCLSETPFFKDELFKFPLAHCPDLLILGLIQTSRAINPLHKELLSNLIPIFLGNHPNSAMVFHLAWHSQYHSATIRNIIMHAMADWYARGDGDQTRLSRILDVAQDLKALSMLLNLTPFLFVIDLACLASRREYLKLDKWLTDKVRDHGESFVESCVNFLTRRSPQIMGGNIKEENLPKSALPTETLATMLGFLHSLAPSLPQELSEKILTMVANCATVLNKNRLPPPGVVKTSQGLQSVLSSAVINTPNTPLDQLVNLTSSVSGLNLGNNVKSSTGNTAFPPLSLGSFTIPSSGSPAKMLSVGTPAIKSGTTSSQITQSQFSNVMASGTPQLPTQFGDVGQILTESSGPVSKEIEDEANSYFQRIYNHAPHSSLPIEEVLDMLKRFKESPIQREREVCSCMIKNLFEEYRFFPQYPDKELQITAQLFGGIVDQNLVSYLSLGLALRYVLESVKKPSNSKMFFFGVTAMDRFKTRLKDYPAYCQHLTTLPNFHELPQNLVEYIEYGARSQEPPLNRPVTVSQALNTTSAFPNITQAPSMPLTTTTTTVTITTATPKITGKPSIANATNIDTLLGATEKDEKLVNPPDSVQDKVSFIVNNLSQSNLSQKTEEFREIVKEEYWPWASQYLVMKRASIEPNFHTLYSNFLDTLKLSDLTKLVIRETFRNIKVLLRSDKTVANFSDRSLLKNLGHWLGILTLAKCKPILQVDIDIKSLIIEAYHNGSHELLYVVPFVAKVLESCAKSKVFKPPNPWTMGIMKVLCELHKEPDLKLNLKFEIEVLCKTLNIDINEIKPSGILKDQDRILKIDSQLSPLPKHKEQQAVGSVNIQVPPQPALSNVVPPTANPLANNVLHEENIPTLGSPPTTLSSGQIPPLCAAAPPQPHFAYGDINIVNLSQIAQHLNINSTIPLFQTHSQLKQFVRVAIERAVQEWLAPVVERSVKISLTTCEQIIKKDFALDPEEARMRASAHHMIRSLTAGMVMITCRDPLFVSIITNLRTAFLGALRNPTPQQKELTEQAAEVVATENLELACCFIQKTAVEKALPEIDKRLASEYEARKHARSEGRRYCDPVALTYQAERMPEQIRLKVGGVTPQQMAVYEEFARMIPGFLPSGEREQQQANLGRSVAMMQPYATDEMSQIYDKLISELEMLLHATNHSNPHILALHSLLEAVLMARNTREMTSAVALLQKAVDGFLEGMCQAASDSDVSMRFRDGHLLVMKALADPRVYGHQWTSKQITRWLIESREECRYNPEAVDLLIRNHLINLQAYDLHLTQSMENGMNMMAVQFAMQLVKMYLLDERHTGLVSEADLYNTVETLGRITSNQRQLPDGLNQLLDMLRSTGEPFLDRAPGSGPIGMMYSGITQAREFDDPPGLYEKTEFLLREWVTMYHSPKAGKDSTNAFSLFVHQVSAPRFMNLQGILKTDELITRFFRLSTEMCVDLSYRVLMDQNLKSPTVIRAKCFHTLDAYVRLIALLVKHSGDNNNTVTKVNLLNKVLGIVTGVLLQDQELRGVEFQQLPYHRIFIMLFLELSAPEAVLEAINPQILTAFCNTLYYLRPQKAPGFAYAWLELVSHRVFLGRVLALSPAQKGWTMYAQLLVSLFKFLAPFLRNVELAAPIQLLYKGTLRVLLVLLHDFPEFLCDYHYGFCDVIAPNCIQMRNLILSAFPRNMRLPDPFTPNLKVDLLPEITQAPRILANFNNLIQPPSFKKDLDSYIKTRAPVTFLSELRTSLQVSNEPGMRYNIPLINALVLYVGTQAIQYIQNKGNTPNMSTITHSSHMDIFQNLAVDSDTEGRYLFLNAIANQLRYPNSHTHYFSCTLLYLFAEANTEAIQEQITRVLLERLIVNRPHPWGLLITFIELIKNQNFKFWNHEFVRCAPEIEKLFESVARSCMHPKPSSEQTTS